MLLKPIKKLTEIYAKAKNNNQKINFDYICENLSNRASLVDHLMKIVFEKEKISFHQKDNKKRTQNFHGYICTIRIRKMKREKESLQKTLNLGGLKLEQEEETLKNIQMIQAEIEKLQKGILVEI